MASGGPLPARMRRVSRLYPAMSPELSFGTSWALVHYHVLYYPMYFLRGFAIHGYPDVPAYPASHGCVRIPMWLALRLFALNGYGTTVIVHY